MDIGNMSGSQPGFMEVRIKDGNFTDYISGLQCRSEGVRTYRVAIPDLLVTQSLLLYFFMSFWKNNIFD